MTHVYLDVETTGLDPDRHEVWEIAYAVGDRPILSSCVEHNPATADPAALRIGNYQGRARRGDGWARDSFWWEIELKDRLLGATLVGANPAFDAGFLRARWHSAPWHHRLLDIEAYAMPALGLTEPKGLAYIAEQLQVEPPDHTATGDVRTLRDCHRALQDTYSVIFAAAS